MPMEIVETAESQVKNGDLTPKEAEWKTMQNIASKMVKSGFLPSGIKDENQALMIMMTGRELGIPPLMALRTIYVVNQKPALSAQLMMSLVLRAKVGRFKMEASSEKATVTAWRTDIKDDEPYVSVWTVEDAKTAGLLFTNVWKKYQKQMLLNRATSDACKVKFPDLLANMYTQEEVESFEPETETIKEKISVTKIVDEVVKKEVKETADRLFPEKLVKAATEEDGGEILTHPTPVAVKKWTRKPEDDETIAKQKETDKVLKKILAEKEETPPPTEEPEKKEEPPQDKPADPPQDKVRFIKSEKDEKPEKDFTLDGKKPAYKPGSGKIKDPDIKMITKDQIKAIHTMASLVKMEGDAYKVFLGNNFGVTTSKDLTLDQASQMIDDLQSLLQAQGEEDTEQAQKEDEAEVKLKGEPETETEKPRTIIEIKMEMNDVRTELKWTIKKMVKFVEGEAGLSKANFTKNDWEIALSRMKDCLADQGDSQDGF